MLLAWFLPGTTDINPMVKVEVNFMSRLGCGNGNRVGSQGAVDDGGSGCSQRLRTVRVAVLRTRRTDLGHPHLRQSTSIRTGCVAALGLYPGGAQRRADAGRGARRTRPAAGRAHADNR